MRARSFGRTHFLSGSSSTSRVRIGSACYRLSQGHTRFGQDLWVPGQHSTLWCAQHCRATLSSQLKLRHGLYEYPRLDAASWHVLKKRIHDWLRAAKRRKDVGRGQNPRTCCRPRTPPGRHLWMFCAETGPLHMRHVLFRSVPASCTVTTTTTTADYCTNYFSTSSGCCGCDCSFAGFRTLATLRRRG